MKTAAVLALGSILWGAAPQSRIEHLVVIVQENHSFDSYFGDYCRAPTGSAPACTDGPACCEAGPRTDPGTGAERLVLTEEDHGSHDPFHNRRCELDEMNGGRMDRYVSGLCGNPKNFAYADEKAAGPYWKLASRFAMGDRVFQSVAGASAANNMYYAQARWAFDDNDFMPFSKAGHCRRLPQKEFDGPHIGDLLDKAGVTWTTFAEGYRAAADAHPKCLGSYPWFYDPSDVPFSYYRSSADRPDVMRDFTEFLPAVKAGKLPSVIFIKAMGIRTEHPGGGIKMADGMAFVNGVFSAIEKSRYAANTLVLVTPDESGGYFDHIAPPGVSPVDNQPYGPRIYLLALGAFARTNFVSHVPMEHSSILRFIEWNWLGGTGQLKGRDAVVNGIGSLLDPAKTGVVVP